MLRSIAVQLLLFLMSASGGVVAGPAPTGGAAAGGAGAERCTVEQGQLSIDAGLYDRAIREFTCVIEAQPTEVEGYRGRIEAQLLLGGYSDAYRDCARMTAYVLPVHPDAASLIDAGYAARLAVDPDSIPALTGASFARWNFFDYQGAIRLLDRLLDVRPDDVYGNLFRGSSRLLKGASRTAGVVDIEIAIALAPQSPDVRYIVADAYTYGSLADPQRAFDEAMRALDGGLDTPRVHAILAASYLAFGDLDAAAAHIQKHIDLVTAQLAEAPAVVPGASLTLDVVPGRTWEIPVPAVAGETLSIATSSRDYWDTILVLLGPDGSPVAGSDDFKSYFAGLEWPVPATGTYRMRVTFFESVNYGALLVSRK